MVAAPEDSSDMLDYCLKGSLTNLQEWGHEYFRALAGSIGRNYNVRVEDDKSTDDLMKLVDIIVPQFINHNEEPEAVDLMMETESLSKLSGFCNERNYDRVCRYLCSCSQYAADTEEMVQSYTTAYDIYLSQRQYPDALRVAQKMNNMDLIKNVMEKCPDPITKKQMAFMLGRQRNPYESEDDEINQIISQEKLSEHYKQLARDLDQMEPKHPEAIFKTHLEERKVGEAQLDSAKQNLAKTYVNAFVNAGLCNDLLICKKEGTDDWVFSNKDVGQMAAAASLGLLQLWDIDEGLESIDKYMERSEENIQAGSYIALGIVNSGIKNEADAAYAILSDKLESATTEKHKIGILMGLSLAYAGSARADLLELISPIIVDSDNSIELQAMASLSIGLIFCGTCDQDAAESITQILLEKEEKDLEHSFTRIFALGLGLLYLGQQSLVETSLEVIKCLPHKNMADFVSLVMETCAYAGSGNVLNIQKLLHICAEHKDDEKESTNQIAAVLGVALIAFGEDIGQEMCLRTMNHLLQYGEPIIRRTVPLAIGLLRISNPEVQTLDLLNKLAYDSDKQVSMSAILSLGLVGAGTNNSKLSGNLRYLATYFGSSPDQLFVVRISQGLIYMGKGMMSLSPMHSNKFLFSNVSLAGLITVLYAATDMETFICGNYHYFLYYLVLSMYPRMLVTLNEKLENTKVSDKVGQAVDTVGAAGKPKTITGFQIHDTPVLIGHGERSEFATEEFLSYNNMMENFVIIRKNPDYEAEQDAEKDKKK